MAGSNQLMPEELQAIAGEISKAFEPEIKTSSLLLLPIDPHRAHANWHIESADLDDARTRAGADAPLVLRLYDITGIAFNGSNARDVVDTTVSGAEGQAALNVWHSGRTYVADLGVRRADGHLQMLARSGEIHIAPAVRWQPSAPPAQIDTYVPPEIAETAAAPAPEVGPWPGADALSALTTGVTLETPASTQKDAPAIAEAHAQWVGQLVSVPQDMPGIVPDLSLPPAVPEPAPRSPAADPVIALDGYMPWSSFACGARTGVEVNAELRVYGHIPPGARATLFGRPVDVKKDGTFSAVVSLGHGFGLIGMTGA